MAATVEKTHRFLGKIIVWFVIFSISILTILGIGTYLFYINDLAQADSLMNRNNTGLILTDRFDQPFYKTADTKTLSKISISNIPQYVKDATVAIEDKDFYQHQGLSLKAMLRSLINNLLTLSPTRQGGSTITQQLVKNALLSRQKTFLRKYQEIILARQVEKRYPKDKILEMYLNSIYYGSGTYGIKQASQMYFGKEAEQVTLAQAAALAALPQSPSKLSPNGGDIEKLLERKNLVLSQMKEQGLITAIDEDKAKKEELKFLPPKKLDDYVDAPHFALWVRHYLFAKYGEDNVLRRGFKVKTTLSLPLQNLAQSHLSNQIDKLKKENVSNGALVAINPQTGEILSLVGSVDWENVQFGKFNVVFAKRQPGSAIKPLIYALALEKGFKTTDLLSDQPTDFNGYQPKNYDGQFRGDVTLRRALANSLNVPSVVLLNKVGVDDALYLAKDMGISTLDSASKIGLSLVLGGGEVELFELTRSYGIFANQGMFVSTHPVLTIYDKYNNLVYEFHPQTLTEVNNFQDNRLLNLLTGVQEPFAQKYIGTSFNKKVLKESTAYIISHILSDNLARSEVFGLNSNLQLSNAAVKTGTTDDYRDSWTISYDTSLAVGVWIGNNDNSPMGKIAGSTGAAPIVKNVLSSYRKGVSPPFFAKPGNVIVTQICATTLDLPCSSCSEKYPEVFIIGQQPQNSCPEDFSPTPALTIEEEKIEEIITPSPMPTETPTVVPTEFIIDLTPTPTPTPTLSLITPPLDGL